MKKIYICTTAIMVAIMIAVLFVISTFQSRSPYQYTDDGTEVFATVEDEVSPDSTWHIDIHRTDPNSDMVTLYVAQYIEHDGTVRIDHVYDNKVVSREEAESMLEDCGLPQF